MIWRVVIRPEAGEDIERAADWYERQCEGLGSKFAEEILLVLDSLTVDPLLGARRHPVRNIRWRYPDRFPYRVIYEVLEEEQAVVVAAVLHAARDERVWKRRITK